MGEFEELFKFAAKAGALEGYLYEREKVEPLSNWVNNIERMYIGLPDNVKDNIKREFKDVVLKTLTNGENTLEPDIKAKLNTLLASL